MIKQGRFNVGKREEGLGGSHHLMTLHCGSLLFVAIERNALIMQDPFENRPTDTPMTSLAQVIERNIHEVLGKELPTQQVISTYFSM